jgi:NAD(P)-dependent dehydrogenase (short-subunit alcohol dehydrogenase family)
MSEGGILITGAAGGLGAAFAEALVCDGHAVALTDRRAEPLAELAERLGVPFAVADVGDEAAIGAVVAELAASLGGVTGLINNAGIGDLRRFQNYDAAAFDRLVRVNLTGTFLATRAAVAHFLPGAAVVNVASLSGVAPTWGEAPYSAAKAAVIALTRSAALELAPLVRVNCVSPGFIDTPLTAPIMGSAELVADLERRTPAGRVGTPGDVVAAVRFLLSEDAAYITGQNLVVDGGASLVSHQTHDLLRSFLA